MKRALLLSTALAVLFCLSGFPLTAQNRNGGGMGQGGGPGQAGQPGQGQSGDMGQEPMGNRPMGREAGGNNGNTQTTMTQKTPSELLAQNPTLSSKVQDLLPSGTNPQAAASGFKDLGEFVATLHVSRNLNIPFDQLKSKVTSGKSLGKALQAVNPNLSHEQVKSEIKKGKQQAKEDIKTSRKS